jgi:hypothetical protein
MFFPHSRKLRCNLGDEHCAGIKRTRRFKVVEGAKGFEKT